MWEWLLVLAIVVAVVMAVADARDGPVRVCTRCGHCGETYVRPKGSGGVEFVLWLAIILPGLVYSVWRRSSRRPVCKACGADDLVPPESPAGRELMARYAPPADKAPR